MCQGEDNGKTLVVFQGTGTVTLTATSDGRQFGPSVLAPFAQVLLEGNAGYVDGFVVANNFQTIGQNVNGLQMHADAYTGDIQCSSSCVAQPTTVQPTTIAPITPGQSHSAIRIALYFWSLMFLFWFV